MKITYLSSSTIPSRTANSIHVMKMCQAFAKNGHEVVLIAPDKKNGLEQGVEDVYDFYGVDKCFKIIKIPHPSIRGKRFIYGYLAARKAKKNQSHIVYGRNSIACAFAARMGLTTIFESHLPIPAEESFFDRLFKTKPWKVDLAGIVVITRALKDYYATHYPWMKDRIRVVPDAADPPSCSPVKETNPYGSKNRLQVGYAGNLYRGKAMEIISDLARQCPWACFHVIGGTEADKAFWQERLGSLDNIIFLGFLPPGEVAGTLMHMDVLLAPFQAKVLSHGSNQTDIGAWFSPLKIFEYMSVGRPIVCSDLPVLREVLAHEKNALLCSPDDASAWTHALMRLRDEEALRKRLAQTAYFEFLEQYTWSARAKKVIEAIGSR
ncbi:MAG: glycosyltransferase family 4 protein [Desulfovermiculus sp.]